MMSCDAGNGQVEDGRAIGIDAECGEIVGQQPRDRKGGLARLIGSLRIKAPVDGSWRQRAPQRRPQALHAATFLVDQNEHLVTADRRAHGVVERHDLRMAFEVAGKKNEAGGAHVLEEVALLGR